MGFAHLFPALLGSEYQRITVYFTFIPLSPSASEPAFKPHLLCF
jgi:hypothetical protein